MTVTSIDEEVIYHIARHIGDPEARVAYLRQVCGDDAALRDRVSALLRVAAEQKSFLESPAVGHPPTTAVAGAAFPPERPGTVVGPYRLLEPIGEGGMGTVYMAEQTAPVRRRVALKLIKAGMDTNQVVARFEAERQALALMDHPNIARVLDAGATDSGRPFFVMELVRGIPITDYCDREQLSIPDRLELFALVCRAVQHAHQKGVIHRDLKPSNVLVTVIDGVAVPKVIDFGVAKATGVTLTERTLFTGFHQFVGTPLYMSPEQADLAGVDVDTRSDVYSLGVLLYELLTGTTPFDPETFRKAAFDEMRRIVREEEPQKPSTRLSTLGESLSTVSAKRKAEPRHLSRAVRGELDWIVMRALEKDRKRRYETVNGFAADVMRYLTDQPVEACPPSAWYRFRKFVRRNQVSLTVGVFLATALLVGTTVSVWQAVQARRSAARARRAEADAERRARESRQVVDYLADDLLGAASPQKSRGRTVTVPDLLRIADESLGRRFPDQPLVEASVRMAIGKTYLEAFWRHHDAEVQAARAVALRERYLGPEHPETLEALGFQAWALASDAWGDPAKAEAGARLARRALAGQRRLLGTAHGDTLTTETVLGFALAYSGRPAEGEALLTETLTLARANLGPDHETTLGCLDLLGRAVQRRGDLPRAEVLFRRSLAEHERVFGPLHLRTWHALYQLADLVRERGEAEEWLSHSVALVARGRQVFGPCPSAIDLPLGWVTDLLRRKGDFEAIRELHEGLIREVLSVPAEPGQSVAGLRARRLAECVSALAELPDGVTFDSDLALRAAEDAAAVEPHASVAFLRLGLRLGQPVAARLRLAEWARKPDADRKWLNNAAWFLATHRDPRLRDPAMAVTLGRTAVAKGPTPNSWNTLGVAYYRTGEWASAIAALEKSATLAPDTLVAANGFFMAMARWRLDQKDQARAWYDRSVAWMERTDPADEELLRFRAEAAALMGEKPLTVETK